MALWQKARSLRTGRIAWVRGIPIMKCSDSQLNMDGTIETIPREHYLGFDSNVIAPNGRVAVVCADKCELLGEFAQDVPLITWADYIKQEQEHANSSNDDE